MATTSDYREESNKKSYDLGPPDDDNSDEEDPSEEFTHIEPSETGIADYIQTSILGFDYCVNGNFDLALELFAKYEKQHPLMANGVAFAVYFKSLIAFDETKFSSAKAQILKTKKLCRQFLKFSSKKFSLRDNLIDENDRETYLVLCYDSKIAIADCYTYLGVLVACSMDFQSYVKAAWFIRKSLKLYNKIHDELSRSTATHPRMKEENRERLLAGASFGYGVFNLSLSMIPPGLLNFLQLFGFSGSRSVGLKSLEYCLEKHSVESRAPFALMVLVWYYTFIKPSLIISDKGIEKSIAYGEALFSKFGRKYESSVFFKLLEGRSQRMRGDVAGCVSICEDAIATFNPPADAAERGDRMRELDLFLQYELAWCDLACARYMEASRRFETIHNGSAWSAVYYLYPTAVCLGAQGDIARATQLLTQVKRAKTRQASQVESFMQSRAHFMLECGPSTALCRTLGWELAYHWQVLPATPHDILESQALPVLRQFEDDARLDGLSIFLQGVIAKLNRDYETAELDLLAARTPKYNHKRLKLIQPYACLELAACAMKKAEATQGVSERVKMEAEGYLKEAQKFKSYDFEQRIQVIVHNMQHNFTSSESMVAAGDTVTGAQTGAS